VRRRIVCRLAAHAVVLQSSQLGFGVYQRLGFTIYSVLRAVPHPRLTGAEPAVAIERVTNLAPREPPAHHELRPARSGQRSHTRSEEVRVPDEVTMDQLVRVQNFTVSADGFGAGEGQTMERPFGDADPGVLMSWIMETASFPYRAGDGGSRGLDDYFARDFSVNVGAEIMGRNKFGPQRGPWENEDWKGWWGDEPPFHTPVFVLTHHVRPSITLSDTTFHFLNASPTEALRRAKDAAGGRDVRIGGGVATVRAFLDAGLVDTLHVAVAPIELGRGERLWHSSDELLDRYHRETVPSPSGVTHLVFWRR
jgi:dihydrofolate reductase